MFLLVLYCYLSNAYCDRIWWEQVCVCVLNGIFNKKSAPTTTFRRLLRVSSPLVWSACARVSVRFGRLGWLRPFDRGPSRVTHCTGQQQQQQHPEAAANEEPARPDLTGTTHGNRSEPTEGFTQRAGERVGESERVFLLRVWEKLSRGEIAVHGGKVSTSVSLCECGKIDREEKQDQHLCVPCALEWIRQFEAISKASGQRILKDKNRPTDDDHDQ